MTRFGLKRREAARVEGMAAYMETVAASWEWKDADARASAWRSAASALRHLWPLADEMRTAMPGWMADVPEGIEG